MQGITRVGGQKPMWWIGVVLIGLAVTPANGQAQMFVGSGSTGTGLPLSGEADFNLGSGSITLTLSNLLSAGDFRSSAQALSDVSFTLSNNISVTSISAATGTAANIDSSGNTTSATGSTTRWHISPNSGNSFLVTTLSGGMPSYLVAPSASIGMGSYPNVNNGVSNFNPYFVGSTSLTINVTGLTRDTTVSDVSLSFGTGPETVLTTTAGAVPAPPSIIMAVTGFGGLGFASFALSCRRRKAILT